MVDVPATVPQLSVAPPQPLMSRYFATSPGCCALCGGWYFDLGWWFAWFPSAAVPVFSPTFLYATPAGQWVCEDCAIEADPAFCDADALRTADNCVAYLDGLEAAGSNPYHYCCLDCCPPWRHATNGCPLSRSRRDEMCWKIHNCTCVQHAYWVEALRGERDQAPGKTEDPAREPIDPRGVCRIPIHSRRARPRNAGAKLATWPPYSSSCGRPSSKRKRCCSSRTIRS